MSFTQQIVLIFTELFTWRLLGGICGAKVMTDDDYCHNALLVSIVVKQAIQAAHNKALELTLMIYCRP